MTETLRPMNLGEILDRTFQIYRSRFLVFCGVAVVPALAMLCIYIADTLWFHTQALVHPVRQPGTFLWNFVVGLGFYHISSSFSLLIMPAHVRLASDSIVEQRISLASALRFASVRWRSYLWIAFLKLCADLLGPEIVLVGLAFGIGSLEDATGLLDGSKNWPFVLLLTVPAVIGIYLFLRIGACLSLAMPAGALESLSGFGALRRSWMLTRGSRVRIMFTWLAIFITSWIASSIAQLLLWDFMYSTARWLHLVALARQLYLPIAFLLLTLFRILLGPIFPIALTLFYYDQRIRCEGYDIERMMETAGLTAPIAPPEGAVIVAPVEAGEALP
ncbi:MAG: hypothetical protein ABR976_07835 [Terracidiphilus sp.]|jgi:hypothetical protein